MSNSGGEEIMIVLSKLDNSRESKKLVKDLNNIFWGDADIMVTKEVQIITTNSFWEKYSKEVEKLASENGFIVEIVRGD